MYEVQQSLGASDAAGNGPTGKAYQGNQAGGAGVLSMLKVRILQILVVTDFYRSLEGSFSAGSTATIATKYSFFQVFRDLQNCLAKFSKKLQNFAKNQRFSQNQYLF